MKARAVTLPPAFDGFVITEDTVEVFPSEDGSAAFIAIRVQSTEDTDIFAYFDEAVWKANVNPTLFMDASATDLWKQFLSMFCAINECTQDEAGNILVSTEKPWLIPIATVSTNQVSETIKRVIAPSMTQRDYILKEEVLKRNDVTHRGQYKN